MHELSLCRSIYGIVDKARDSRSVATVHLQVGQLRQVVPDTLCYCWSMITEASPLAGSELEIDHVPVRLDCRACGERTTVEHVLVLTCASCSSGDISLHTGEEFMVTSIDLAPPSVVDPTSVVDPSSVVELVETTSPAPDPPPVVDPTSVVELVETTPPAPEEH
ncbi:hydrogenase maturation nickel metallochaperone HypA [Nocardioides sp.]|uniref:hydrogenase maturation nickel metallochaperone HypA n=1 Tax=Nocardioides sp. TaxID=35761 RepID=UPI003D0D370F